jgi:hypothetical protein
MDHLQTRLEALEQRTHTVARQLRWWRGLACALLGLAGLTWALPAVTADDAKHEKKKDLEQRVAALEKLLKHFSRKDNEVIITGANLHIVNGLGSTDCTEERDEEEIPIPDCPNGVGNLIVGYNEPRFGDPDDPENIRTGSHNVVVGQRHNFSRIGGLVVGDLSTISGDFATVSGGRSNTASGDFAAVSGGESNTASGRSAAVSGGSLNTASGDVAAVSGGGNNTASGIAASISGGNFNIASGFIAVVSGGEENTSSGDVTVVSGGRLNTASSIAGPGATVSGGRGNTASGGAATVSGGDQNTASGGIATVSGGRNITQETDFGWAAGSEGEEVFVGNFRSP